MVTEEEIAWYGDLFGRGAGDPDFWGYPGEEEARKEAYDSTEAVLRQAEATDSDLF